MNQCTEEYLKEEVRLAQALFLARNTALDGLLSKSVRMPNCLGALITVPK